MRLDLSHRGDFPLSSVVVHQDATELLRSLSRGSVQVVITDPAYESLEKHRTGSEKCRRLRNWFPIFHNNRYPDFFKAAYRAMAKNSHLYIMCDEETADVVKPIGVAAGFKYWKACVWDRVMRGTGYHYANTHEFVLFFEKGKMQLNDRKHISIVRGIQSVRGGKPAHKDGMRQLGDAYPTEKPVELYRYFIENSALPGDLVVDPFCGSGNSALAALSLGCDYIGGDVSKAAVLETKHRVDLYHRYLNEA